MIYLQSIQVRKSIMDEIPNLFRINNDTSKKTNNR